MSAGFIRDVRLAMKKLARAPVTRDRSKAAPVKPADMLTGSRTADVAVSAFLANAGVRFISQGVATGMERNPRRYERPYPIIIPAMPPIND